MKLLLVLTLFAVKTFASFSFNGNLEYLNGSSYSKLKNFTILITPIKIDGTFGTEYPTEFNNSNGYFSVSLDETVYNGLSYRIIFSSTNKSLSINAPDVLNQDIYNADIFPYQTNNDGIGYPVGVRIPTGTTLTLNDFSWYGITNNTLRFGSGGAYESILFTSTMPCSKKEQFINACYIYDSYMASYDFIKQYSTTNPYYLGVIYDPSSPSCDGTPWQDNAWQQPGTTTNMICIGSTYEKDLFTLNHEFGHHIMGSYGFSSNDAGGYHYLGVSYSPSLAYSEGWANFFSVVRYGSSTVLTDGVTFNFEKLLLASSTYPCKGYENELAVAGYLYDLYDNSPDDNGSGNGQNENVYIGFQSLFNATKNNVPNVSGTQRPPINLIEFLYNLNTSNLQVLNTHFNIPPFIIFKQGDELVSKLNAMAANTMAYFLPGNYTQSVPTPTINLKSGQYIMGADASTVNIFGYSSVGIFFYARLVSNVKIENIKTRNRVVATRSSNIQVENCIFEFPIDGAASVSAVNSDNVLINNNLFRGNVYYPLEQSRSLDPNVQKTVSFINNTCATQHNGPLFQNVLNTGSNSNRYFIYNNIVSNVSSSDGYGFENRNEFPGNNQYYIYNDQIYNVPANHNFYSTAGSPYTGLLTTDPQYANTNNYTLSSSSPCVNSGNRYARDGFIGPFAYSKSSMSYTAYKDRDFDGSEPDRGVYGGPKAVQGSNWSTAIPHLQMISLRPSVKVLSSDGSLTAVNNTSTSIASEDKTLSLINEEGTIETKTKKSILSQYWTVSLPWQDKSLPSNDIRLEFKIPENYFRLLYKIGMKNIGLFAIQDSSQYVIPYDTDAKTKSIIIPSYIYSGNACLFFAPNGLKKEYSIDTTFEEITFESELSQNTPNPFNPNTTIGFNVGGKINASYPIELSIYDLMGKKIITLLRKTMPAGYHTVQWNGQDWQNRKVATGVYTYKLICGSQVLQRKMMMIK